MSVIPVAAVCGFFLALASFAAEPATNQPPVRMVSPGIFQVGLVRVDAAKREISLPAEVNMREGQIEYVVVSSIGKLHESIFKTPAEPFHIHAAALLLLGKPAGKPLAQVEITIETDGKSAPATDYVFNQETRAPMQATRWNYLGSRTVDGVFIAQRDGSILAIIADEDALADNPGPDREKDEIWQPVAAKLPPIGQPARVIIRFPQEKSE